MLPAQPTVLKSTAFWLTAAAATLLIYWLCLAFLYPKYFAPLSAFHVDFYGYVGIGDYAFLDLMKRYPRPVSFLAMKLLSYSGLLGLMAGGIAIALVNVLLTMAIVRKMFGLYSWWLLISFVVYAFLLFAHPEFYIEHRHDLPAQVSYLFLALSLLAWVSWIQSRSQSRSRFRTVLLLVVVVLSSVLFVFAKESYFLAALCLVAGMAVADRNHRRWHVVFLLFLLACECGSFAWNLHVKGPFVDPNASADGDYKISLAPGSLTSAVLYYLQYLVNPGLVLLVALILIFVWRDKRRLILAVSFVAAGLAVIAPHAILPNHLFREYAWAPAPLFLAPVMLLQARRAQLALAAVLVVVTVVGPFGYREIYRTDASRWEVAEDRKGGEMAQSLSSFRRINRPARILVTGLDDGMLPWQSPEFVRHEFGDKLVWTVLLPRSIQFRQDSRLVHFASGANIRLSNVDYVASYRPDESLADIRPVAEILGAVSHAALLDSAKMSLDWGLRDQAEEFLAKAKSQGAPDAAYQRLMSQLQALPIEPAQPSQPASLTATPGRISQPDGTGLAETELFWNSPDGAFCEIHVDAPDGPLFTSGKSGHIRTGKWVRNGMQFFLQDVSGGKPLTSDNTLAKIKVEVTH
jgi:hypothetical protein